MQGLRGCRNAGIPVPKEIIDKAINYIRKCTVPDGGVQYSSKGGGGRPADHRRGHRLPVQRRRLRQTSTSPSCMEYCRREPRPTSPNQGFGHWHYAHYYYSQVLYREGGKKWEAYRDKILRQAGRRGQTPTARWNQGYIGPVYTTAINLTILQLDNGTLPIYQR